MQNVPLNCAAVKPTSTKHIGIITRDGVDAPRDPNTAAYATTPGRLGTWRLSPVKTRNQRSDYVLRFTCSVINFARTTGSVMHSSCLARPAESISMVGQVAVGPEILRCRGANRLTSRGSCRTTRTRTTATSSSMIEFTLASRALDTVTPRRGPRYSTTCGRMRNPDSLLCLPREE